MQRLHGIPSLRGKEVGEKKGQLTFCIFCKYHLVFIMKDHKQELPSGGERPYFHLIWP